MIRSAGFIWEQPGSARVSMEKKKRGKEKKKSLLLRIVWKISIRSPENRLWGIFCDARHSFKNLKSPRPFHLSFVPHPPPLLSPALPRFQTPIPLRKKGQFEHRASSNICRQRGPGFCGEDRVSCFVPRRAPYVRNGSVYLPTRISSHFLYFPRTFSFLLLFCSFLNVQNTDEGAMTRRGRLLEQLSTGSLTGTEVAIEVAVFFWGDE